MPDAQRATWNYRVSVILARDLTIEAGIRTLLHGASLNLQSGDKVGLVGRNGAGKTTLMRTLAGELNPAEGHLARSGRLGYLSQESALPELDNPDLSALDRILTARDIGGLQVQIEEVRRKMEVEDGAARAALLPMALEAKLLRARLARAAGEFQLAEAIQREVLAEANGSGLVRLAQKAREGS